MISTRTSRIRLPEAHGRVVEMDRTLRDLSLLYVGVSGLCREWMLTDVRREKNLKEGCGKVVDALNVSTRWVSYCPYVKNSF